MPSPPFKDLGLPTPSAQASAASARVVDAIRQEIDTQGPIPFSRFMQLALYAPGFGYYAAGREQLGAGGDFITAPESFPLFGRCLANAVAPILAQLPGADILEVGAGSGKLAADLLADLVAHGVPPTTYYILDVSAELRARQAQTIEAAAPTLLARVRWLDRLPETFHGLVIGNELLDAMPVERFRVSATGIQRLLVAWRTDRFVWRETPASESIRERIAPLALPTTYVSEIGFAAEAWVRSIADILRVGVLLLIDYGFPRAEFYHPDRATGTLMCHYRHRTHADPLILVGLQDITAHVDFTAIAEAGVEAGLDLLGYTSQAAFLIGSGLDRIVAASDPSDTRAHLALTEQVKKLTLPHEMGELCKVIALGRGVPTMPRGFQTQDRRARLGVERHG